MMMSGCASRTTAARRLIRPSSSADVYKRQVALLQQGDFTVGLDHALVQDDLLGGNDLRALRALLDVRIDDVGDGVDVGDADLPNGHAGAQDVYKRQYQLMTAQNPVYIFTMQN